MGREPTLLFRVIAMVSVSVAAGGASADDIEPRRWTPLPVGTTVAGVSAIAGRGSVALDPLLQIEDGTVEQTTVVASAVHAFDLWGKQARIDLRVPYRHSRWEGMLAGLPRSRDVRGFADPRVRLSVNVLGPPALDEDAFRAYRAARPVDTIAGLAMAVSLPLGDYDDDKLLNLGSNRFAITPQLGVVHVRGPWSFELTGSVSFFTDNDDFLVTRTLEQDPVWVVQGHVVYAPSPAWWASVGAAYDWGGASRVDGAASDDYRETAYFGVAGGVALDRRSSVQITYVGNRAQQAIGTDTDNVAIGYSIRF